MALGPDRLNSDIRPSLLTADDPSPVQVVNPTGAAPFLLIGDHAGNRIPAGLGSLGLTEADRRRHIAWDIGIAALGRRLSGALDAVFVRQTYSRLVVDCNRAPGAGDAMPAISDGTAIAGNGGLTEAERDARLAAIHAPYHRAIADELARRDRADRPTILVSLHSFTPRMNGRDRPWQIGVLHDGGDPRFALACLRHLRAKPELVVGDNEPYAMDRIDYTIPRHAFAAGRPYVEIEIRQDLLGSAGAVDEWAGLLKPVLEAAAASLAA